MAAKKPSIGVKDFNELISCFLCKGYLIDATTVIECLHSFCKTCIIIHLESNTPKSRFCPRCDNQIHKTKPKLNIRSDPTLQDIVYKLVPGLYKNEMNRRKEFYSKEPESAMGLSNEEKGEVSGERLIFTPEDSIYIAIEYFPQVISYSLLPFSKNLTNGSLNVEPTFAANGQPNDKSDSQRRYLKCEGGMRVLHLKKWLKNKYDVRDHNDIEILYKHDPLLDDYTMMDLAYIYSWRRNGPLCLYYKIVEPQKSSNDEDRPFKTPETVKRRHTIKHRHRQQNNKKRKIKDESNLITTNPVNEPLPPVDSALIDRVMATNSIGANLDFMRSVINSALNMNNTSKNKQKPKKSVKNGHKTDDSIKQMKKKLDKSLKTNKKSVPNKKAGDYVNSTNVDLTAGALNNTVAANGLQINKTTDKLKPPLPAVRKPKPVVRPPNSVVRSPDPVVRSPNPIVRPPNPVVRPPKPVVRPPKPVVRPPKPVVRPPNPVVRPPNPVVRPPKPVVRPPNPVVRQPDPVARPPNSVVRPPNPIIRQPNPVALNLVIRPPNHVVRPTRPVLRPLNPDVRPLNPDVRPLNPDVRPLNSEVRPPNQDVRPPNPEVLPPNHEVRPLNLVVRPPTEILPDTLAALSDFGQKSDIFLAESAGNCQKSVKNDFSSGNQGEGSWPLTPL